MTRRLVVTVLLGGALVVGAVLFPRAEEPGRADAAGYTLNPYVVSTRGLSPDWYVSGAVRATPAAGGLRVTTGRGTIQILARPLAVFAHRCYAVTVDARSTADAPPTVVVMDEDLHHVLAQAKVPARGGGAARISVWSGALRRLSITIWSGPGRTFVLRGATVVPGATCDR